MGILNIEKSMTYELHLNPLKRALPQRRKSGMKWERKAHQTEKKREPACKPGSVEGNHSSRTYVAARLKQPTRRRARAAPCPLRGVPPYLVLLQVGFAVP